MKACLVDRGPWLVATAALVLALLWLDQNRGGPASILSRCNLLLSRSEAPAADVLIVGSSRSGTALDPLAMQGMLSHSPADTFAKVERIALGNNPLRASHALLENYLEGRGAPRVLALEIMFMTERSVDRLDRRGSSIPPERYLYRRDLNLMTFDQILKMPAVAMPFSEGEGFFNLWRYRLRGVVLRTGALVYQFLRRPVEPWQLSTCDRSAWTREPTWPSDFEFSYGDFVTNAAPDEEIDALEAAMTKVAASRELKGWQSEAPTGRRYPYDFDAPYREGEVTLLNSMLDLAARHNISVVLLPLPLYGYAPHPHDLQSLRSSLPTQAHIFDLYAQVQGDLNKFWYDDAHVEVRSAGALTSAILARHILDHDLLGRRDAEAGDD